jgi:hypothetical protein
MKIYRNAVVLLCLPRDQRETLKFRQDTSSSCLGRVRWPAVNLKMIRQIWTEASRNRCTEIGCSGYSQFSDEEVTLEVITIHNRGGGENPVTPQTPVKTIEHLESWRERLWIRCRIRPCVRHDVWKMGIVQRQELTSQDLEKLGIGRICVEPGFHDGFTETHSPGLVAGCIFCPFCLVLHGFLVALPYWQAVHMGDSKCCSLLGTSPRLTIAQILENDKCPALTCNL